MQIHTIKKGDTLWQIAKENHLSLDSLIAANPQIPDPNKIFEGDQINIPEMTSTARKNLDTQPLVAPAMEIINPLPRDNTEIRPLIYILRTGDTWESIARTWNISMQDLWESNRHLLPNSILKTGDRVVIPGDVLFPSAAAADMPFRQSMYPRHRRK